MAPGQCYTYNSTEIKYCKVEGLTYRPLEPSLEKINDTLKTMDTTIAKNRDSTSKKKSTHVVHLEYLQDK